MYIINTHTPYSIVVSVGDGGYRADEISLLHFYIILKGWWWNCRNRVFYILHKKCGHRFLYSDERPVADKAEKQRTDVQERNYLYQRQKRPILYYLDEELEQDKGDLKFNFVVRHKELSLVLKDGV